MGKLKWVDSLGREWERVCNSMQEAKDYCKSIGLIDEYNHPVFITDAEILVIR